MAPSGFGPPPEGASKASLRREPIILPGFDRRKQLDISFKTIVFGAVWLRRIYTKGQHKQDHFSTKAEEVRSQEIRYGNNIAVLLKACFHLRQFYDTPDFWYAIANGFGTSADVVRDMVELLVDARNIYRSHHPDEVDIARSGANFAADQWHSFLANQKADKGVGWSNESIADAKSSQLHGHACAFFRDSERKQEDIANVTVKEADHQYYNQPASRKRYASAEPLGQPPSPKRRTSSNYFERNETLPNRPSQRWTPPPTGIQIKGSAKQDYYIPIGESDQPSQVESPAYGPSDMATEIFRRIRGTAAQTKNGLPASGSGDFLSNHALTCDPPRGENQSLRERVVMLEKELSYVKSQLPNELLIRHIFDKMMSEMAVNSRPSTLNPTVESLQARIASLENNAIAEAARHEQKAKQVKECINVAKDELAALRGEMAKIMGVSSHDKNAQNHTQDGLENVQQHGRLVFLGYKPLAHVTTELQPRAASIESKVAILRSPPREPWVPVIQELKTHLTRVEDQLTEAEISKDNGPAGAREVCARILELENRFARTDSRLDEGENVRELESRVAVIEHHQDKSKREYATEVFVETICKQLDSRFAHERDAVTMQLQSLNQRLTTMETQNSTLTKTIDTPGTSSSPSTSQYGQRNMGDMFKTMGSVPTEASASDMILRREQVSETEIEKLQQSMCEMSAKMNSLSNITNVFDGVLRLEKNWQAELERHQKDTKELETLKVQLKGLDKLWEEATTGIAKPGSLLALKAEVDALKGDIATQSARLNIVYAGLDKSKDDDTVAKLEDRVTALSTQLCTTLSGVTAADLSKRFQQVQSKLDTLQSATRDTRVDSLTTEVDVLNTRVSTLARALNEIGHLM